ncbi:hypothetical protein [Uliginosibacterium aquaticum]|nr:hypothetical protein [Uliginosibacterium aquaticum]
MYAQNYFNTSALNAMRNSRLCSFQVRLAALLLFSAGVLPEAWAQHVIGTNVKRNADAVLTLMTFTITPDVTTSSLSLSSGSTGNPNLQMSQLGGGFTLSKDVPVYMEGNAAYSRFDPKFLVSNGTEEREVPMKWNTASVTVGLGWDFKLMPELSLRPIFNYTQGYVSSDASLAASFINYRTGSDIDFLKGGKMSAYGNGGSLMLDWEKFTPEHDTDLEIRYTNVTLRTKSDVDASMNGSATAESLNVWSRLRVPTGWVAFERPVRYVYEGTYSEFFGDQAYALGFKRLFSLGFGLELDTSATWLPLTQRARLVARHVFGEGVSGWSLGMAISF